MTTKEPPSKTPWYDPIKAIEPQILAKIDPEFVTLWTDYMNEGPPRTREDWAIDKIRADPMRLAPKCALDTKGYPRTAEKEVTSEDGAQIPLRVYYPDEKQWGPGPYPVHLNFHGMSFFLMPRIWKKKNLELIVCMLLLLQGGGFVLGGLFIDSTLCMSMCDGAGVVVIDVNYRHCPGKFLERKQSVSSDVSVANDKKKNMYQKPSGENVSKTPSPP